MKPFRRRLRLSWNTSGLPSFILISIARECFVSYSYSNSFSTELSNVGLLSRIRSTYLLLQFSVDDASSMIIIIIVRVSFDQLLFGRLFLNRIPFVLIFKLLFRLSWNTFDSSRFFSHSLSIIINRAKLYLLASVSSSRTTQLKTFNPICKPVNRCHYYTWCRYRFTFIKVLRSYESIWHCFCNFNRLTGTKPFYELLVCSPFDIYCNAYVCTSHDPLLSQSSVSQYCTCVIVFVHRRELYDTDSKTNCWVDGSITYVTCSSTLCFSSIRHQDYRLRYLYYLFSIF